MRFYRIFGGSNPPEGTKDFAMNITNKVKNSPRARRQLMNVLVKGEGSISLDSKTYHVRRIGFGKDKNQDASGSGETKESFQKRLSR